MAELTIEQRVQNGINLLDERGPSDWRERVLVAIGTLDIGVCSRCVLGLIFGEFSAGIMAIEWDTHGHRASCGFIWDYYMPRGAKVREIAALTAEWKRRLTEKPSIPVESVQRAEPTKPRRRRRPCAPVPTVG